MRKPPGIAEAVAALVVITAVMFHGLGRLPFHGDESHWIGLSGPFEAFAAGRFSDPIWQERQDMYVGSPVTYYVIGAARRIGGWPADSLNAPWLWNRSFDENEADGRVPAPDLLWWGRAGVTAAAAAGVFILFRLFTRAGGRAAGYAWLALALASPYLRDVLRHAMNEGVLVAALALALWCVWRGLEHADPTTGRAGGAALAWIAAASAAGGLAAQTKLSGALAVVGILAVGLASVFRQARDWRGRVRRLATIAAVVTACSTTAFVGLNPSVWPHPARETVRMVRARIEVTKVQMGLDDGRGLPAMADRLRVVPARVFLDHAVVPLGWAGVCFFIAGAWVTLIDLRQWIRREHSNHAIVVLSVIGAAVSVPMLLTPLDRPRFFLLPVLFFSFPTITGVGALICAVGRRVEGPRR